MILLRSFSAAPFPAFCSDHCLASYLAFMIDRAPQVSFRKHDVLGSGLQHRKPASGNLKE